MENQITKKEASASKSNIYFVLFLGALVVIMIALKFILGLFK